MLLDDFAELEPFLQERVQHGDFGVGEAGGVLREQAAGVLQDGPSIRWKKVVGTS